MIRKFFDRGADSKAVVDALNRSLAVIEFDPDGTILSANENFCAAMGYALKEIKGKHHRLFVEPAYAQSGDYQDFWLMLARGQFESREYKRLAKGGREVWLQASYNPVKNAKGVVTKVVKFASVITDEKLRNAELDGKINAVSRVQAMIEFTPQGEILTANENFLSLVGYRIDEIQGKHHRMFVEPTYGQSAEYRAFWDKLNAGEYIATSFQRFGKGGKELWIQASYNPLFDMSGRITKVVKFASDITDLTEIGKGLAALAANDLDHEIAKPFGPAFEKLRQDYNLAHQNLRGTMLRITEGASAIQSGTREISIASQDLSRRTEQQAASLEETTATMDTITTTVKRAAEGATQAREIVLAADNNAKLSVSVVKQATEAMDAIAQSAHQVTQIIGVIDEIAFQTNLLALNAGVEAARAGDAGRGFAVVASEVRALAQRSAEAAKEIKQLISSSSNQVEHGVKLVAETGKSLERIMSQVAQINGVVAEIAAGAQEQSTSLNEVNAAMRQMDQVTQQNAAMVEESTSASHSLSQETETLHHLISQFRVGHGPSREAPQGRRAMAGGRLVAPSVAPASKSSKPSIRPVAVKAVVNGPSVVMDAPESWEEF